MKTNKIKRLTTAIFFIVCMFGCTDLDEVFYDQVTPDTFFKSKQDVYAFLRRPFTHNLNMGTRWRAEELTSDQFVWTQKGKHGQDGGQWDRLIRHNWTPEEGTVWDVWRLAFMGIALALDTKETLKDVNYEKMGLTQADKEDHLNQLATLNAYVYLRALDAFGGVPIYTSTKDPLRPRSTRLEVFNYIEAELKYAIPRLAKRTLGKENDGSLYQGSAAAILMRLYFNAKIYINQDKDAEALDICNKIIAGEYGDYKLSDTWDGPFNFNNKTSDEMVWGNPSQKNYMEFSWYFGDMYHYTAGQTFDVDMGGNNGIHLTPSRNPSGNLYTFNIGNPYESFSDGDLRKKPYKYSGDTKYEGMFLIGQQFKKYGTVLDSVGNPIKILGSEEYKDKPLIFVDQVARLSELREGQDPSTLASNVTKGEENSGVRWVKFPIPDNANKALRWGSHYPTIRLTEVCYTKAEILFNRGDKLGAASIINEIRKRNFENGTDPDPVPADFDKYRLAKEWGIEFLGEWRRRSDLIRWGMFHTEVWWSHETPDGTINKCVFPIPRQAISSNNLLEQNPGYY